MTIHATYLFLVGGQFVSGGLPDRFRHLHAYPVHSGEAVSIGEQAYSYAIHKDIRVPLYALCRTIRRCSARGGCINGSRTRAGT